MIIEVGSIFGKLTVISKSDTKRSSCIDWNCRCECGKELPVKSAYLRRGETSHCGCSRKKNKPKDITGKKLNRLTAIETTGVKSGNGDYIWRFKCDCGNTLETTIGRFNFEHTKSCGCLLKDSARAKDNYHGMDKLPVYTSWRKMRERCYNPNDNDFYMYGSLGITVCDVWNNSFHKFYEDMGHPPQGYTLDRIDGTAGYSKNNCRWASRHMQARNRWSNIGKSQYKGVVWEESSGKWIAAISIGEIRQRKIGRFLSEHEAAQAYNEASELIFGKGSDILVLNKLPEDYKPVTFTNRFFSYWVPRMIEEKDRLY
jgi:hypothetical protein